MYPIDGLRLVPTSESNVFLLSRYILPTNMIFALVGMLTFFSQKIFSLISNWFDVFPGAVVTRMLMAINHRKHICNIVLYRNLQSCTSRSFTGVRRRVNTHTWLQKYNKLSTNRCDIQEEELLEIEVGKYQLPYNTHACTHTHTHTHTQKQNRANIQKHSCIFMLIVTWKMILCHLGASPVLKWNVHLSFFIS